MSQGDWLVLSRTRHMLNDLEESLYRQGLYYENRYKRSSEKELHQAATSWEHLRQGQLLSYKEIENMIKFISLIKSVKRAEDSFDFNLNSSPLVPER